MWGVEPSGLLAVDHSPLALAVSTTRIYVTARRYGLFTTLPVARETVFERVRDGVVVADDRDQVVDANAAARRLLGLDADAVGSDLASALPAPLAERAPSGADGDAADTGAGDATSLKAQVVRVTVDDEPRFLEHRWTTLPRPTEGTVLAVRDVTERTRVRRRYRAYVEHARDVIVVTDGDGDLEYVTPAIDSLLGYDADDLVGDRVYDHVHPDDPSAVRSTFRDVRDNPDDVVRVSFRARHANGGWRRSRGAA